MIKTFILHLAFNDCRPAQRIELLGRNQQSALLTARELYPEADRIRCTIADQW